MKKTLTTLVALILLTTSTNAWATPPGFSGGVNDEYQYEEMVFLTGEPIKFVGEFDVTERERDTQKTVTYNLKLTPEDKSIDAELQRKITVVTDYTSHTDKGQTTGQTSISKYSETLEIGENQYKLEDFQFSKSDIIDNRPASDFYSGNLQGRKYYSINKNEGSVIVEISGGDVGYENFWGNTETRQLDYTIICQWDMPANPDDGNDTGTEKVSWEGTVQAQVSDSMTKTLKYADNEANYSSFSGGHARVTNREVVSRLEYNLPKMVDGTPDSKKRNKGTANLSRRMLPRLERLIVPKFRDTGGHWAQEYIEKLYSLDVYDETGQFFVPNVPMTRMEFTRAIIRGCDIRTTLVEEKKTTTRRRNQPPEVSPFTDISTTDADYQSVKDAVNKGIINGITPDLFKPNDPLTRAQAITILIRALGFEHKAPTPGYYTSFSDDYRIPEWARDSIYVAREIGLVQGDDYNNIHPAQVMTRAEASAMLVRFLEFLEHDLQEDYRENIINF